MPLKPFLLDPELRSEVFDRPNVSAAKISEGLDDVDFLVRQAAISHPNATPEHIEKGLQDHDQDVRTAAQLAKERMAKSDSSEGFVYHAQHQMPQTLQSRDIKTHNSLGTWFTSSSSAAKELYGPHVQTYKKPDGNFLEAHTENFHELLGSNLPLIEKHFGPKAAKKVRENHKEKEAIQRKAMLHEGYNKDFRSMLERAGYHGIVWHNSKIDSPKTVPHHTVYLVFNKKPIDPEVAKSDRLEKSMFLLDPNLRAEVFERPNVSSAKIHEGLNDPNLHVRHAAMLNPSATSEHIDKGLQDPKWQVRHAAVLHPNATPEHIEKGLQDPHEDVRYGAQLAKERRMAKSEWEKPTPKDYGLKQKPFDPETKEGKMLASIGGKVQAIKELKEKNPHIEWDKILSEATKKAIEKMQGASHALGGTGAVGGAA